MNFACPFLCKAFVSLSSNRIEKLSGTPTVKYTQRTKRYNFSFSSRGANYLAQILLRPGASDLTGSFRFVESCKGWG